MTGTPSPPSWRRQASGRKVSRLPWVAILWFSTVAWTAIAQQANTTPAFKSPALSDDAQTASRRSGAITGRVLSSDGQPLASVMVFALTAGLPTVEWRETMTDDEGRFQIPGLTSRTYFMRAYKPGYVLASDATDGRGGRSFYRPGDSVTITLLKGGVITGKVTDSNGEPVVTMRMQAIRVRDAEGMPVSNSPSGLWWTDDRGVYRLYGLPPGSYLVATNGGTPTDRGSPYSQDAPTYFPATTRAAATEITVRGDDEVTGVDISYRGEPGRKLSGLVSTAAGSPLPNVASIRLTDLAGRLITTSSTGRGGGQVFTFQGLSDGEYYLIAYYHGGSSGGSAISSPRRVTVKGTDVTGIELKLAPLTEVSGRIVLEAGPQTDCVGQRPALLDETIIIAHRDEKERLDEQFRSLSFLSESAPNDQGYFTIRNLEPKRYWVETRLPSESWYVRAITLPADAPARQPRGVARDGLTFKAGERATGLSVMLAEGAASLSGRVAAAKEGARLPARLIIHLIPAERDRADDPLRFAEVPLHSDGQFTLTNLAPGRYWLLARVVDEASLIAARPAAWDGETRAGLRREAEAANAVIDLQPCQRITDYVLRYASPSPRQ